MQGVLAVDFFTGHNSEYSAHSGALCIGLRLREPNHDARAFQRILCNKLAVQLIQFDRRD